MACPPCASPLLKPQSPVELTTPLASSGGSASTLTPRSSSAVGSSPGSVPSPWPSSAGSSTEFHLDEGVAYIGARGAAAAVGSNGCAFGAPAAFSLPPSMLGDKTAALEAHEFGSEESDEEGDMAEMQAPGAGATAEAAVGDDDDDEEANSKRSRYGSLIKFCAAQEGTAAAADALAKALESESCPPTVDTFNSLIHACSQASYLDGVHYYMNAMANFDVEPNIVSYNSAINAYALSGDLDGAARWLEAMMNAGFQPNEVTYGTICKAFSRCGNVDAIESIMCELEKVGFHVNEYFYASLITACGIARPPRLDHAENAFFRLANAGLKTQCVKRPLSRVVGEQRVLLLFRLVSPHGLANPRRGLVFRRRRAGARRRQGADDRATQEGPLPVPTGEYRVNSFANQRFYEGRQFCSFNGASHWR
eukprot:TRINITY_DN63825_c0_g1_i1.p1 TRINITY_DN63825_c0_g1~~TRINITY_DN63825_c0_g1_i1.p1  ORF type:complete len:437 (-),score=110.06 TRINITY_DN63825_c0_g1_i1:8-1273(-)